MEQKQTSATRGLYWQSNRGRLVRFGKSSKIVDLVCGSERSSLGLVPNLRLKDRRFFDVKVRRFSCHLGSV